MSTRYSAAKLEAQSKQFVKDAFWNQRHNAPADTIHMDRTAAMLDQAAKTELAVESFRGWLQRQHDLIPDERVCSDPMAVLQLFDTLLLTGQ